jgi:hypothetical protein
LAGLEKKETVSYPTRPNPLAPNLKGRIDNYKKSSIERLNSKKSDPELDKMASDKMVTKALDELQKQLSSIQIDFDLDNAKGPKESHSLSQKSNTQ